MQHLRYILPAELPLARDVVTGLERPATELELLQHSLVPLGGNFYDCGIVDPVGDGAAHAGLPGRKVTNGAGPARFERAHPAALDSVRLILVYRYLDGRRLRLRLFLLLRSRLGRSPTPLEMLVAARRLARRLDSADSADWAESVWVRREETNSDDIVDDAEPDAEPHRWSGEPVGTPELRREVTPE